MGNSPRLLAVKRAARATKQARRFHPSSSSHPIHQFIAFFFCFENFICSCRKASTIYREDESDDRPAHTAHRHPPARAPKEKKTYQQTANRGTRARAPRSLFLGRARGSRRDDARALLAPRPGSQAPVSACDGHPPGACETATADFSRVASPSRYAGTRRRARARHLGACYRRRRPGPKHDSEGGQLRRRQRRAPAVPEASCLAPVTLINHNQQLAGRG